MQLTLNPNSELISYHNKAKAKLLIILLPFLVSPDDLIDAGIADPSRVARLGNAAMGAGLMVASCDSS